MIITHVSGEYAIFLTKSRAKVLKLDKNCYEWIDVKDKGQVLVLTQQPIKADEAVAEGFYRYYEVKNEPNLSDNNHLELSKGEGKWEGYLILPDLPKAEKKHSRIIKTAELISAPRVGTVKVFE